MQWAVTRQLLKVKAVIFWTIAWQGFTGCISIYDVGSISEDVACSLEDPLVERHEASSLLMKLSSVRREHAVLNDDMEVATPAPTPPPAKGRVLQLGQLASTQEPLRREMPSLLMFDQHYFMAVFNDAAKVFGFFEVFGIMDHIDAAMMFLAVFILLVADTFLLQRNYCCASRAKEFQNSRARSSLGRHIAVLFWMFLLSAVYGAGVWLHRGKQDCVAWSTGYVLEWALSMDNLFVFHLIFKSFKVPRDQVQVAFTLGIYGALALRVIFILGLAALVQLNRWVKVVIGLVMVFSGFAALQDDDDEDVQDLKTVRLFRWCFGERLLETYDEQGRLFIRACDNGYSHVKFSILFLVVCTIMVVDLFFAVDSTGSKAATIPSPYLNLSSSLMAMMSLRAMFFIIEDMIDYFELLKYGICAILAFVGVQIMISSWHQIPLELEVLVILALFFTSIFASLIRAAFRQQHLDAPEVVVPDPQPVSVPWPPPSPKSKLISPKQASDDEVLGNVSKRLLREGPEDTPEQNSQ